MGRLSEAIKQYFIGLIEQGKQEVEITEANAEIQRIINSQKGTGFLLELPCKVGSKVYQITRNFISEYRIRNFICYDNGNIFFDWECIEGIYVNVHGFHIDEIGKNVFLTKAEAEKALEEMEK